MKYKRITSSFEQRSEEWKRIRCGKFTSSNFYKLMGSKATMIKYLIFKAEQIVKMEEDIFIEDGYRNEIMQKGIEDEPESVRIYESLDSSFAKIHEVGFVRIDELNTGSSPDRLVGSKGLLEVKNPEMKEFIRSCKVLKNESDLIKYNKCYYWQVQHQLFVCGKDWADFAVFNIRLANSSKYKAMNCIRVKRSKDVDMKIIDRLNEANKLLKELLKGAEK